MNNIVRLLFRIAATKNSRVKDVEAVVRMLDLADEKLTALEDSHHFRADKESLDKYLYCRDEEGLTPFMHAARAGNLPLVKWFVEKKQIRISYAYNTLPLHTALYFAAHAGQLNVATYLLEQNAHLHLYDVDPMADYDSVFAAAVMSNKPTSAKILELLLKKLDKPVRDDYFLQRALKEAIKQNNCQLVAMLLEHVPAQPYYVIDYKYNLLGYAININAHPYIIAMLYATNPALAYYPVHDHTKWDQYPVKFAIKNKNVAAVFLLTSVFTLQLNGKTYKVTEADIEKQFTEDLLYRTLNSIIESSTLSASDEKIYYLLQKAEIYWLNRTPANRLDRHTWFGWILSSLAESDFSTNRKVELKPFLIYTLLQFDLNATDLEEIAVLAHRIGINLVLKDLFDLYQSQGLTQVEIFDRLEFIKKAPKVVINEDEDYYDSTRGRYYKKSDYVNDQLDLFKSKSSETLIVEQTSDLSEYPGLKTENDQLAQVYLSSYQPSIQEQAKPVEKIIQSEPNIFTQFLMEALDKVEEDDFQKIYDELEKFLNNDELFLKFSKLTNRYHVDVPNEWFWDLDGVDKDGNNLLSEAIRQQKNAVVFFLLKRNANANFIYQNNETPLLIAASTGNKSAILDLIRHEADFTVVNSKKQNAAILAMIKGHTSLIDLLHKLGVSFTDVDSEDKNALTYATHADNKDAVKNINKCDVQFGANQWQVVTERDSIHAFGYLYHKCQKNSEEDKNQIAIWAVKNNALKILDRIKNEIDFTKVRDEYGNSLLQIATDSNLEVFRFLIERHVPFDIVNNWGNTVCDHLVGKLYEVWAKDSALQQFYESYRFTNSIYILVTYWVKEFIYKHPNMMFLDPLDKIVSLLLKEEKNRELAYSKETKERLFSLVHCIAAKIVNLVTSSPRNEGQQEVAKHISKQVQNHSLGMILAGFASKPFRSDIVNAIENFLENFINQENPNSPSMSPNT